MTGRSTPEFERSDTATTVAPSALDGRRVISKIAVPAAREITGVHALGGGAFRAVGAVRERSPGAGGNVSQGGVVEVGEKRHRSAVADAPVIGFDQMWSLR